MMRALATLAKVVILLALVSVVPVWLAVNTDLGVLVSVGISIGAAILLAAIWTRGRA